MNEFGEEHEKYEENLREQRHNEQKIKGDYSYEESGEIETCDNCKSNINSNGHCPLCDY